MQQTIAVWQGLDIRRRAMVAVATVGMFAAVLLLSGLAAKPSMALLYAGLEGPRAGDVITALEQRGAGFEVRGDAIYVSAPDRDALRMQLAADGLPTNGGAGYELLDTLTGFGTTSQMFDAAYWRAKEGELARTIVASPTVRAARVHIATPTGQPFRRDLRPTASVSITSVNGGMSPAHAKALKFLVSSAVAGMAPEDVAVIDDTSGLILAGDEGPEISGGQDRAAELKQNVERLLEARVGYGNAVVEISVETVTESEAITERSFDPNSRVAISTDTEERTTSSSDSDSGAVTVASNLPQGAGSAGDGSSQSQNSETRERTNFEVSETTREILRAPGAVRRLSVAVLVDAVQTVDAAGQPQWQPRAPDELADLRDLVASAVGFDEARGDVITLKSLPFLAIAETGSAADPTLAQSLGLNLMSLVQVAVLGVVALVLGLFVLRPILLAPPAPHAPELPPPRRAAADPAALTGEIDDEYDPGPMAVVSDFDLGGLGQMPMGTALGGYDAASGSDAQSVARLRRLIDERKEETLEILRGWMESDEEHA